MAQALSAKKRDMAGPKAAKMRAEGSTPAVLYGQGIEETVHLTIDSKPLTKAIDAGVKEFELEVEGEKHAVTVQDVDRDFLKDIINHVDFIKA